MIDLTALKNEVNYDPIHMGYAGKSPVDQAALLNATTGPGAAPVARAKVAVGDPAVATMLAYALTRIYTLSDASKQNFYATLINVVMATGYILPGDSNVQATIALALADGVVTQALVGAVAARAGSRAEALFGEGTVVRWQDVAAATAN